MIDILLQSILPFVFSAGIVIVITTVAERYGTKVGGIIGTLPSTIIVAYVFIALNKGVDFASTSIAVVPAEMGINMIFLLIVALVAYRSTIWAFTLAFVAWGLLSTALFFSELSNMAIALGLYLACMLGSFAFLERYKKIPSIGSVKVHYTLQKIIGRGLLAGVIISLAVLLANTSPTLSGIFAVFPAILTSTMVISIREHGSAFAGAMAKSLIFGTPSMVSYTVGVYILYPLIGILFGSIVSLCISCIVAIFLLKLRAKLL